jgi:hypothetical protein
MLTKEEIVARNIATLTQADPLVVPQRTRRKTVNKQIVKKRISSEQDRTWKAQKGQVTLFYNIFIPTDQGKNSQGRAHRIVSEQLNTIGKSAATKIPRKLGTETVLYQTGIDATMTEECTCFGLTCIRMIHYDDADEDITLDRLQDFCRANPHHRVTHLHNKGSYHFSPQNTLWRRSMTISIVDKHENTPSWPGPCIELIIIIIKSHLLITIQLHI